MLDNKKVTELLRKKGFKVTPQRLAIYNALCNTKAHPNAEMIFNKLINPISCKISTVL